MPQNTTRLSDLIEPEVYGDYQSQNTLERTALVQSGIAVTDPMLDAKAASGGRVIDVPFWRDLGNDEPDIGSDDPDQESTPGKIAAGEQLARIAYLNKSWSASDLASEIAGANAMNRIKDRVEAYWQRAFQRRILATVRGVLAANMAAGGDMVHDIATDAAAAPSAGELFSRQAFTGAQFTLGDAFEATRAIAVHSLVYKRMVDNDDIEFVADSTGTLTIPTYMGRRVVVDDGMPVIAGAHRQKFVSVLFGAGAIGYGTGTPAVPVEVHRAPSRGNGSGVETLYTRKTWLLHPAGFSFTGAHVAGPSASLAELANGDNWARVVDERKAVPLSFLITNG